MDTDKSVQQGVQQSVGTHVQAQSAGTHVQQRVQGTVQAQIDNKGFGMEVRVAILEERTKRMDEDFKELTREVQVGFANIQKLMSRNPVKDFISEHWMKLLIFAAMLLGKPAAEILKMLAPLIKGVSG